MKLVRTNVFETNSSSTHTLVVPHKVNEDNYRLYDSLDHEYQFGRCELKIVDCWDEKLAYIYYVLLDAKERYEFFKGRDDEYYGSPIKVTAGDIRRFKNAVIDTYKEVKKNLKYRYRDEFDPHIIFSLLDYKDDLDKVYITESSERDDSKHKGKDVLEYTYIGNTLYKVNTISKDDLDRSLYDYELDYQYDDIGEDEVNILVKPSLKEKRLILVERYLNNYTCNNYHIYQDEVYVDHTESFKDNGFITKLLECDREFIKRFLYNTDSYIAVGGDEYHGFYIKKVGFEYDYGDGYDDDNEFFSKVEELEKDNDIWLKGC